MAQSSLPPLVLGVAGFGTVGTGLARILSENKANTLARTGREITIKTILVRDLNKKRAWEPPAGATLTVNPDDLVNDPEIDVIVELMGGVDIPKAFVEKAFAAGKHVVTANKAMLAETGNHLFALAAEKNLYLGYEASVCGGIPIIQTLREGLAANNIESLMGIFNGTCNYILSEMTAKGMPFQEALAQAQALGYAEADPTLDIGGFDAAHKLALLIRLAWGVEYPYGLLPVQGIDGVDAFDITCAGEFGYRIKLIGQARMVNGQIEAGVFPTLAHETSLLAQVEGPFNAVRVQGNAVGSVFLHGRGAGDLPTGSAVAADIFAVAKNTRPNNTGFSAPALPQKANIASPDEALDYYYIRLQLPDAPGVLRDVSGIMADNNISIAQAIQKDENSIGAPCVKSATPSVPFTFMTHETPAKGVKNALAALVKSNLLHQPPVHYRVLCRER